MKYRYITEYLKVHGDLSGVNANFNVLSSKKLKLNNIQFNESFKSQQTRVINVTFAGGKYILME